MMTRKLLLMIQSRVQDELLASVDQGDMKKANEAFDLCMKVERALEVSPPDRSISGESAGPG